MAGAAYLACCIVPYFIVQSVGAAFRRCFRRDEPPRRRGIVLTAFDPTASDESSAPNFTSEDMDIVLDDSSSISGGDMADSAAATTSVSSINN